MNLRPSSMPAIEACPAFQKQDAEGAHLEAGKARHEALAAILTGGDRAAALAKLPADDAEGVEWAADYIRAKATTEEPIRCEHTLDVMDDEFRTVMPGTPDAVAGPDLFDLKWKEKDYDAQLVTYALARMQETGRPSITCHILFGASKRARTFTVTAEEAAARVARIIAAARDPNAKPTPCNYCSWCADYMVCKAITSRVAAVQSGREDWTLPTYHATELKTADDLGRALTLARLLAGWCEAVEAHANIAAKKGVVPTGFQVRVVEGRKWVADVAAAYNLAGVPQEAFLKCCDLRLNTSAKYPDKVGICEEYAAQTGQKKAPAKRALMEKLAPVIRSGKPSTRLVELKAAEPEPEN